MKKMKKKTKKFEKLGVIKKLKKKVGIESCNKIHPSIIHNDLGSLFLSVFGGKESDIAANSIYL